MRERVTIAVVLLTVALSGISFAVRTYSLTGALRHEQAEQMQLAATTVATAVRLRQEAGQPVDAAFLDGIVGADRRIVVHSRETGREVVVAGPAYRGPADADAPDDIWAAAPVPGGYLTVSESGDTASHVLFDQRRAILVSFLALAVVAGLCGYVLAQGLSHPFRRLALAARSLGRGRFDLDLPRSRIPEVREIADALRGSAVQLQQRITQEQAFAEHASHVLRTPLTSLRLELDDLALREDLPDDVRPAVDRCVQRIDSLDAVAGELIRLSRTPSLAAGTEQPLREIAAVCAQRWADELAHHDRTLTAAVEGDLETTYTPGPLEHIHELLLVDVLQRSHGAVRLVYEATQDGALKLHIVASEPARVRGRATYPGSSFDRAGAVVTALGGRLEGVHLDQGLDIVLPRR